MDIYSKTWFQWFDVSFQCLWIPWLLETCLGRSGSVQSGHLPVHTERAHRPSDILWKVGTSNCGTALSGLMAMDCENITWSNIWPCTAFFKALYIRQEIWCNKSKATNNYLQSDSLFSSFRQDLPKTWRSQSRDLSVVASLCPAVESTLKRGGNDGCDGSPVQSGSKDGLPGHCHWESNFVWKGKGKEGGNGWWWFWW